MSSMPKSLDRLIRGLARMPGIGAKTAERLAFYILRADKEEVASLAQAITDVKGSIRFCSICNSLSEEETCSICQDLKRDRSVICVVENPGDIIAVEKMNQFNGRYFCLMGSLSPLDSIGPEELKIGKLVSLIKAEGIKELIIATDSDHEGNTTALYLSRVIKPLGIKLTRIAFGLPVGSNVEYADQATLIKAFEGRRQF